MDDTKVTTEQAISWLEKRLEQRPTPGERVVFSMALSALRTQQEKKPGGWISVKDRLPEDGETVLTFKNGITEVQVYEKKRNGWIRGNWFWSMATVSHWMPMPEPPEEE